MSRKGSGINNDYRLLMVAMLLIAVFQSAEAATWEVCHTGCIYSSIQSAINATNNGDTVLVHKGTYYENIDFSGKQIELTGIDPNESDVIDFPAIDGNGTGPVVSFTHGEDPNCTMTGFVITRGEGDLVGGIYCQGSSPTIANCLIVGNRVSDPNGAAIYCSDSNAVFTHCTIVDNVAGTNAAGIVMENSDGVVTNSIVWNNVPQALLLVGSPRSNAH